MKMNDWSRKPNPERLDQLIQWVQGDVVRITYENFDDWLPELAYDKDQAAACPNGRDHPCNNGLGDWLGIEPYGQRVPWDKQYGYSADRLNVLVDPRWRAAVVAAPLVCQKLAYVDLLTTLRDRGEFVYRLPLVGAQDFADLGVSG